MTARVVRAVGGKFLLEGASEPIEARGACRSERIVAGDLVAVENGVIARVLPRRNKLVRPNVANVDLLLILLAPVPEPDLLLVDKILIYADTLGVGALVVPNKTDLADEAFVAELRAQYAPVTDVVAISAQEGSGLDVLRARLCGKVCVLCGQSAVGKSTLLNALCGETLGDTGAVGARSGRGRHTTRRAELYPCAGGWIVDTPGFSELDGGALGLDLADCDYYFPELFALSRGCRFARCTHTHEPDCAVKVALARGEANAARYERYLRLREELASLKKY